MSEEEVGGQLDEEQQTPEVQEELQEAKEAHADQRDDPGATEGQGVEGETTGYAAPDPGAGDEAPSEIPEGVDALTDEQIQAAEERGGGGDEEGGGDALDVSAIMQEGGGDDEAGEDAPESSDDPDAQAAADTDEGTAEDAADTDEDA
ncbi:MAG TPA: hypothetical protein VGV67_01310 [Solirubrobacteraceae bacterium]|nr:hypothetical protein [Solirubrobacteraceae bacterium]